MFFLLYSIKLNNNNNRKYPQLLPLQLTLRLHSPPSLPGHLSSSHSVLQRVFCVEGVVRGVFRGVVKGVVKEVVSGVIS